MTRAGVRIRSLREERWPIAGRFVISRGAKTEARVVVLELESADGHVGWGECVPYARYGETPEQVIASIASSTADELEEGVIPRAGSAAAALDAARLDLEAQRQGRSVADLLGLPPLSGKMAIARTLSIDTSERMQAQAAELDGSLLKVKLAGDGLDLPRIRAIREGAPSSRLWLDVNEGWDAEQLREMLPSVEKLGVTLLEQPLPEAADHALVAEGHPVPICADESAHGAASIERLVGRYDLVNVKLDKSGGIRGALDSIRRARECGMGVVLGCMVSTSLSIAPACLLAPLADVLDLDGSLLLARDREGGARLAGGMLVPPEPALWGNPRKGSLESRR